MSTGDNGSRPQNPSDFEADGPRVAPGASARAKLARGMGVLAHFFLPTLLVYALFVLLPIFLSIWLSFFRWDGITQPRFVGLANYFRVLQDSVFWRALGHNFVLVVLSLVIQLPLALLLAVLLSRRVLGRAVFRTVYFMPMVLPTAAIGLLWSVVYLPGTGILDRAIGLFVDGFSFPWLGSQQTVLLAVVVAVCWRYTGFHLVLFMAGLESIPEALYEAARVDGASEWQIFRHVSLPLLLPVARISATLSVVGSLKYFDLIYVMTGGGPAHASELVATYMFKQGITGCQVGRGSTIAVALFVVAFCVALVLLIASARRRKS